MGHTEQLLFQAIQTDPGDDTAWVALADHLEEEGQAGQAELTRLLTHLRRVPDDPDRPLREARLRELLALGMRPVMPVLTLSIGMELVLVPPGSFLMGSPTEEAGRSDDETWHRVTLTRGFWLGATTVTQAQWRAVMGSNPSRFLERDDHPVEAVCWADCEEFCSRLRRADGRAYRLPTEAEWEYACRAGTTTPFHFGAALSTDQANYNGEYPYGAGREGASRGQTTPAGRFQPNGWGVFDMHGNVWEWCADWYAAYPQQDCVDPAGPTRGSQRVVRGGSWLAGAGMCRSACRTRFTPGNRFGYIGCRVCFCPE